MQTFLPSTDIHECADILDWRRCGKQRVEVLQILKTLSRGPAAKGWAHHPAVLMWRGYEPLLIRYGVAMCVNWINRGYRDTCTDKILSFRKIYLGRVKVPPWWSGNIHATHRAALLAKDFMFYREYRWKETPIIEYLWPVTHEKQKSH